MDIYQYLKRVNINRIAMDIRNVLDVIAGVPKDFRDRPNSGNITVFDSIIFEELSGRKDSIKNYLDNACSINDGRHIIIILDGSELTDVIASKTYELYNEVRDRDITYTLTVIDKAFLDIKNILDKDQVDKYTYKMIYELIHSYPEVEKVFEYIDTLDEKEDFLYKPIPDMYLFIYTILSNILKLDMSDFKNASYTSCMLNCNIGSQTDKLAFEYVIDGANPDQYEHFIDKCYHAEKK